jgi:hypothetical protein
VGAGSEIAADCSAGGAGTLAWEAAGAEGRASPCTPPPATGGGGSACDVEASHAARHNPLQNRHMQHAIASYSNPHYTMMRVSEIKGMGWCQIGAKQYQMHYDVFAPATAPVAGGML